MRNMTGLAILFLGGCATFDRAGYATMLFEQPPVMGISGGILGIGKVTDFRGTNSVQVKPGERVVYYRCPGTLAMDEQPNLRATFERGATYVLECEGPEAVVRKKSLPN